jgi:hypothetical protein
VESHTTFLIHSADTVATNSTFTAASHGQSRGPFSVVSAGLVYTHICGEAIRPGFFGNLNFEPVFTILQGLLEQNNKTDQRHYSTDFANMLQVK